MNKVTLYVPVTTTRKAEAAATLTKRLVKECGGVTVIGRPYPASVAGFWENAEGVIEQDTVCVLVVLCKDEEVGRVLGAFRLYGKAAGEKAIAWDSIGPKGFDARIEDVEEEA